MQIENGNKNEAYLDPDAKVYITRSYQSFIKPKNFKNQNKKLKSVTVEFLTENFEPKDVDHDKVYAENEFYFLRDNNEQVEAKLKETRQYSGHSELMTEVGNLRASCLMKQKLLKRLGGEYATAATEFEKKFENVLKKDNSTFISSCLEKMKNIEHSVGLEFAGSLLEMVQANDELMVNLLENCELGPELQMPEEYERVHVLSDDLLMFAQDDRDEEDFGVSVLHFYNFGISEDKKKVNLTRLDLEPKYSSRNYIYDTKYFPQANLLVLLMRPGVDENTIIQIYETHVTEKKITMEPRHKIETEAEHVTFIRSGGVDYIVYTLDKYEKKSDYNLVMSSLAETLENPKVKPVQSKIPMEMLYYRPFKLNNNLLLIEGDKDELALFDIAHREVLGYYKQHKKQDYYNYFQAAYSKSKNLLFLLHNNQSGAIISSFKVVAESKEIIHQEDFNLFDTLKNEKLNPYINQYFTLQFNAKTGRLNVTDDDYQILFTLRINDQSKIVKAKDPVKLNKFEIRDSSCWGHFLRVDGDSYFMHYFPYEAVMRLYELKDND